MKKIFTLLLTALLALPMMAEDETVTVTPVQGVNTGNISYSFTQDGITVTTSKGGQYNSDFRVNAGEKITFSADKKISAISINGYVKKGFTATADAGTVNYVETPDDGVTADPVLTVTSINATSVTITCVKQLQCKTVTVYYSGTPEVIPSGGDSDSDESAYSYESKTATTVNTTFTEMEYWDVSDATGDATYLTFQNDDYYMELLVYAPSVEGKGVAPGVYQINNTASAGTAQASTGGDDEYDYPCYVDGIDSEGYWASSFYIVSGTITVEETADGIVVTVDGKTFYGSTIKATFCGTITDGYAESGDDDDDDDDDDDTGLDYSYEPTETTTVNAAFAELTYYSEKDDEDNEVTYLVFQCDESYMELLAITAPVEGTGIAPGVYEINNSGEEGTLYASPGGDDNYDYPSFLGTDFNEDGYYTTSYYLVSGTLTVESDATGVKMTLNGTSYNGSTIKATYTGMAVDAIDTVKTTSNNGVQKVVKNGRILIQKGGETYNIQGMKLAK